MPAARRNARKIRGSAAGMMILRTRSVGDSRRRARYLHQARLNAADGRAGQDQDRPDACECDDRDLHAVAETQRDQRDRQQRDGRNGPDRLDGDFHQPVEDVKNAKRNTEGKADGAADREPGERRDQRIPCRSQHGAVLECLDKGRGNGARRRQRVALQMNRAGPDLEYGQDRDRKQQRLDALRDHASDALMKSNSSRRSRRNSGFSRVVS